MRIIIKCAALFQAAEQLGVIAVRDPQLDSRGGAQRSRFRVAGGIENILPPDVVKGSQRNRGDILSRPR